MNERIRELELQAIAYADSKVPADNRYNDIYHSIVRRMMVELILQDCMEVCRRGKYDGRDDMSLIQFNNGIRFCMNAIDEHFGD